VRRALWTDVDLLRSGLLAVAIAGLLAPNASPSTPPRRDDPCGDNGGYVVVEGGPRQPLPTTARTGSYDLRGAAFTALEGGGLQVRLTMCAPITDDTLGGYRFGRARLEEDCWLTLGARNGTTPAQPRRSALRKECFDREAQETRLVFDVTLPATSTQVEGADLTVTARPADLTPAAAGALAAGTVLDDLDSFSAEYETGTMGGGGGSDAPAYELAAPSALDLAGGGGDGIVLQ
jgi:hypothetical protein